MKTTQMMMIAGVTGGYSKAITFDPDKRLSSVILVAVKSTDVTGLSLSDGKSYQVSELNKSTTQVPAEMDFMLRMVNKLLPDLTTKKMAQLNYQGCLCRRIYLS